jgi:hypothetical protein
MSRFGVCSHFGRCAGSVLLALAVVLSVAASAFAAPAPPPNDNRTDALSLGSLPSVVHGTTVGSTTESTEPGSNCATAGGSVWYSLSVGSSPPYRLGVVLSSNGNLDAVLDVYTVHRSQIGSVDCQQTDTNGDAALAFTPTANTTYLIRVSQLSDSAAGTFTLRAFAVPAPTPPPGKRFGWPGAHGTLDGTFHTDAAYSMQLIAGSTYKINLVKPAQGCMRLNIFVPGTGGAPLRGLGCGGYRLFTPEVSGLFSFQVVADSGNPGLQRYGLYVRRATFKEMAPGISLPNLSDYKGFLRGNVDDDVRLLRFDVIQRSDLTLFLEADANVPVDLKLLTDRGRYLQCNCGSTGEETIRRQISPGRYFVVVQAENFWSASFTLSLKIRLITHVNVTFDNTTYEEVAPGTVTRIAANVTPAVDGPVTIRVDFFDPVERWQFYRNYHVTAVNGVAQIPFLAPHIGRWRATANYDGTTTASPATSGVAQILAANPLPLQP